MEGQMLRKKSRSAQKASQPMAFPAWFDPLPPQLTHHVRLLTYAAATMHFHLLSITCQFTDTIICLCLAVELERRVDFELREGLVESRYWSAVTSHTGYWCSHDIALFLLTFIYKQKATPCHPAEDTPEPDWGATFVRTQTDTRVVSLKTFVTFKTRQKKNGFLPINVHPQKTS